MLKSIEFPPNALKLAKVIIAEFPDFLNCLARRLGIHRVQNGHRESHGITPVPPAKSTYRLWCLRTLNIPYELVYE